MTAIIQIDMWADDKLFPDPSTWTLYRKAMWRRKAKHPDAPPIPFKVWLASKRPGRPVERPNEIQADRWYNYQRAMKKRLDRNPDAVLQSFEEWCASSQKWFAAGRAGGEASRLVVPEQVCWKTIIPRRILIKRPEIEVQWHKRLYLNPSLERTHRVHLLGIQKRAGA